MSYHSIWDLISKAKKTRGLVIISPHDYGVLLSDAKGAHIRHSGQPTSIGTPMSVGGKGGVTLILHANSRSRVMSKRKAAPLLRAILAEQKAQAMCAADIAEDGGKLSNASAQAIVMHSRIKSLMSADVPDIDWTGGTRDVMLLDRWLGRVWGTYWQKYAEEK